MTVRSFSFTISNHPSRGEVRGIAETELRAAHNVAKRIFGRDVSIRTEDGSQYEVLARFKRGPLYKISEIIPTGGEAMTTKVDWTKVERAAVLLEEAGMPYLAAMARRGGTAADHLGAGTLVRCENCSRTYRPSEDHDCPPPPEETGHLPCPLC